MFFLEPSFCLGLGKAGFFFWAQIEPTKLLEAVFVRPSQAGQQGGIRAVHPADRSVGGSTPTPPPPPTPTPTPPPLLYYSPPPLPVRCRRPSSSCSLSRPPPSNQSCATAPLLFLFALAAPAQQPSMLLVDRYVRLVDELEDVIQKTGSWQLDPLIEGVLADDFPECTSREEAEEKREAAIEALVMRYRAEVEISALASLSKLKASRRSRPGALRREPVAFSGAEDPAYYSEVLDGIDLHLHRLADPPRITSLSLGISWPPDHHLRTRPPAAFIAGCDESILVLYVGTYRPCLPQPGFYLVYNSWADSVAIVPPLSCSRVNFWSHYNIGGGVAVLNFIPARCYVLAELLLRKDDPSRHATLFMWWSPGSGPLAGRWIQKEVALPLPLPADEDCSFLADMAFAAAGTSLCWVDLLTGILVCNLIDRLATNIKDARAVFHFIPLPPKCAVKLNGTLRGQPEEYRSMCPVNNGDTFKFVSMVGYREGSPMDKVVLTTWTLKNALSMENWEWEEDAASFCIRDLWDDPIYKDKLKLQPLTPSFPVLCTQHDGVMYLSVTDYEYKHGQEGLQLQATGFYELGLDMLTGTLFSAIKLPSDERGIVQRPWIFTSHFGNYLNMISD
ncbi:hypothetical protein SETIT_7G250400v2 [Setaria italica]|uniref:DUF1618 domain-containing protein n=1 Tax=Setaria italica TaxID=4555 RepID=A0A368RZJ0_SETIT|nr:hypothetical protein SETIT_7G250400v2 [Setaria italica]